MNYEALLFQYKKCNLYCQIIGVRNCTVILINQTTNLLAIRFGMYN
jgi:hypothetical protein